MPTAHFLPQGVTHGKLTLVIGGGGQLGDMSGGEPKVPNGEKYTTFDKIDLGHWRGAN